MNSKFELEQDKNETLLPCSNWNFEFTRCYFLGSVLFYKIQSDQWELKQSVFILKYHLSVKGKRFTLWFLENEVLVKDCLHNSSPTLIQKRKGTIQWDSIWMYCIRFNPKLMSVRWDWIQIGFAQWQCSKCSSFFTLVFGLVMRSIMFYLW